MSEDQQNQEKRELSVVETLTRPAEEFVNDSTVETAWLSTAVRHMETYYKLISSMKEPSSLRLTPNDDFIFDAFKTSFPELNVELVTEEAIKSAEGNLKPIIKRQLFLISFLINSQSKMAAVLQ